MAEVTYWEKLPFIQRFWGKQYWRRSGCCVQYVVLVEQVNDSSWENFREMETNVD